MLPGLITIITIIIIITFRPTDRHSNPPARTSAQPMERRRFAMPPEPVPP
jgi:hypothetical protein